MTKEEVKICPQCGLEYTKQYKESYLQFNNKKFCGQICSSKSRKGVSVTYNTGKTWFKKGEKPINFGKKMGADFAKKVSERCLGTKHKLSTREKMSISHKKRFIGHTYTGDKTLAIRRGIEIRLWREAVFSRDSWICALCGVKGGRLVAHHIKNFSTYPELRTAIDNGITLCKKCHINFHIKYGYKNNDGSQIKLELQKK